MDIALLRDVRSRSISAENPHGEAGRGGAATSGTGQAAAWDLGAGWKISPNIIVEPGTQVSLAEITGPGVVRHLWLTVSPKRWRHLLLRMHWDDDPHPAVLVPLGDFFGQGFAEFAR